MTNKLYLVPVGLVPYYLDFCGPGIRRALERNAIGDWRRVFNALKGGEARLWMVYEENPASPTGTLVGYGATFCENGYCNIWTWTGDLKRFGLQGELDQYAREQGCHTFRTVGPRAWQRVLGDEWKIVAVVIERKVPPPCA